MDVSFQMQGYCYCQCTLELLEDQLLYQFAAQDVAHGTAIDRGLCLSVDGTHELGRYCWGS